MLIYFIYNTLSWATTRSPQRKPVTISVPGYATVLTPPVLSNLPAFWVLLGLTTELTAVSAAS